MTFWTAQAVADALELQSIPTTSSFSGIQTDTRSRMDGALFVALKGDRFDGHAFIEAARNAGARAAIVRRGTDGASGMELIEVDDPLVAYGRLARYRRRAIDGPVVAITGTNGKTSTKEFVRALLTTRWKTHATRSNNNNRVGVPLTILEAEPDVEALVVEAGANEVGEIADLRAIIEPTVGIVTNVAAGHLSGFGSLEGVLREKLNLLRNVPDAVCGEEPAILVQRARELAPHVVTAGLETTADYHPDDWAMDDSGFGTLRFGGVQVRMPVPGVHQMINATIAMRAGLAVGLPTSSATALSHASLPHGRCEVIHRDELTILDDTYNANPASMAAALELAAVMRQGRRLVIVVGSMLELGEASKSLHRAVAERILALRPDLIGAVGEFAGEFETLTHDRRLLVTASNVEELGQALRGRLEGGELVLLKASRGVGLERVIPHLIQS